MTLLGAILAGGASTRFGSDKAVAMVDGVALLDHAIAALAPQVDALVIVGRDWPGFTRIDDLPAPGFGPLGGLAGALDHGRANGYDAVLVAPCDTLGLPADLAQRLSPGPAVAAGQRAIGLWPTSLAAALIARLTGGDSRALHVWAHACDAREIDCGPLRNVNHAGDLG
jgi:molybdenum cofactor guanylyltransferase